MKNDARLRHTSRDVISTPALSKWPQDLQRSAGTGRLAAEPSKEATIPHVISFC